ncbi:MAG: TlyA family RNA methyltransferase [Ruminococcaceae bacterium]|nr:TlyA family RNA methyltransferase [Oscillospiraceae bacterium]
MSEKIRLDIYLTQNGYAGGRDRAKAMIMAGEVFVNNQRADKAGDTVGPDDTVEVRGNALPFVSRGGLKLQKAMESFGIELEDKICMDIGASTGGFTDCMLQHGAKKVYAVDVGYGQLAWKLRTDEKVVNMERTNIRYVTENEVPDKLNFGSVDVSFISLKLVLPVLYKLSDEKGEAVCLIKPQFEAGREKVGKKGVVRDEKVHKEVIENTLDFTREIGYTILGLDYSPIKGPQGNIEFLMYISKTGQEGEFDIDDLVKRAHNEL